MTIEDAIDKLRIIYEHGSTLPTIRTPVAWALYKTWRWAASAAERERREARERTRHGDPHKAGKDAERMWIE